MIGTLCRLGAEQGHAVVVSTGDKDLAQLVTPQVTLINTMSNERLDVAGVAAKFGVPPERIVDYLSLIGDTVDNIPGVAKVGPKTAAKWIVEHGSLDGVIAAAAGIKGVAGDNLRQVLDWLPTGRKLVTVRCDCDLSAHLDGWPQLDRLAFRPPDAAALLDFYAAHGFKSFRRELETRLQSAGTIAAPVVVADAIERRYETITTLEVHDNEQQFQAARPPAEKLDQIERRLIRPMKIFNDDDCRQARALQHAEQRREQPGRRVSPRSASTTSGSSSGVMS